ncbi:MAG: oligosaccharide flippase family protein [Clostridia bacterium]|nr:oligosaccharide flippase family protein [Clostridia bacterium]
MAKSLFKAVFVVAIFSIITRAIGFLFRIYLSREMGAELLGIYHIASSVFMIFVLIVSSGLPLTISKNTAKCIAKNDSKNSHFVATSGLIIGIVASLIICLLVVAFQNQISQLFTDSRCMKILLILLPAVLFSAIYAALRGVLWGKCDYFSLGWTELFEQIIRIIVFVLFAEILFPFGSKAELAGYSMTIACFLSCVVVIFVYYKKGGKLSYQKGHIKEVLKSSTPITGVRTISSLIQPIIAVLFPFMMVLNGFSNSGAMAVYGAVMGMTFPLLFLPSTIIGALSFALIPELSSVLEQKRYDILTQRIKSGLLFSLIISALFVPVFMGLGVPICQLLFNNTLSGEFLVGASIIMIPLGLSNITSSILNSLNLEVKSFVNNLIGGASLIVCIVAFSGILQAYSLVLGFGLCMLITTTLNLLMIKKHTKIKLGLIKPTLFCLIFIILSALLSKWLYGLMLIIFPNIIALIMSCFVCVLSFVLLCVCFKLFDVMIVFSKVKNIAKFSKKKHKNV